MRKPYGSSSSFAAILVMLCVLVILFWLLPPIGPQNDVIVVHEDYVAMQEQAQEQEQEQEQPRVVPKRTLYVDAIWGLGNRLRTYNVAYDLAISIGWDIVIFDDNHDKLVFNTDLSTLFHVPNIKITNKSTVPPTSYKVISYNVENDCSLLTTIDELVNIGSDVCIYCCGLQVPEVPAKNLFYKLIQPSTTVLDKVKHLLESFHNHYVVGVHIRQGSVADYKLGNFFGTWNNKENTPPLLCCMEDKNKNMSSCPEKSPSIDRFIATMKLEPSSTQFFICSDRPGCILHLAQEFPNQIIHNGIGIEYEVNTFDAFCDWYCLSQCQKLILTQVSSFSGESIKVNNIPYVVV
jgi:hypothetical protein